MAATYNGPERRRRPRAGLMATDELFRAIEGEDAARLTIDARPWWRRFSIFANPYHTSGALVARIAVSWATILWALVVMYKPDALKTWPGSDIVGVVHENYIAAGMLITAVVAQLRLVFHRRPLRIGGCVYALMALLWVYSLATLLIAINLGTTALRPGQVASVTIVAALALFAFVSNPRRDRPR